MTVILTYAVACVCVPDVLFRLDGDFDLCVEVEPSTLECVE